MLRLRRVREADRPWVQSAAAVNAQRAGRERRDLVGQLLRLVECAARLNETRDEADLLSLLSTDRAACENHVQRSALTDQAGQPDRAEVDQRNAETPVEHAERRVSGGDPQVAPQRELEPSSDRVALDRGDHRLAQTHPRPPPRTSTRFLQPIRST